ncbi:MAG: hypothetical protein ACYC6L_13350 [Anaerolineae bacterium]
MKNTSLADLVLRAVALALAAAVVVLGYLRVTEPATNIALLGVGLFALALSTFQGRAQS